MMIRSIFQLQLLDIDSVGDLQSNGMGIKLLINYIRLCEYQNRKYNRACGNIEKAFLRVHGGSERPDCLTPPTPPGPNSCNGSLRPGAPAGSFHFPRGPQW